MSRVTSVLDVDRILKVAQARCADHGVTVKFDRYAETASTNGSVIKLPVVKQPVTQASMDKLYGYLIHECGHHLRSEVFAILKAAKPSQQLAALYNIVEDEAMERDMASRWRGDHIALANANDIIMNEAYTTWSQVFKDPHPPVPWAENDNGPIVAMLLQQIARKKWDSHAEVPLAGLIRDLPAEPRKLLDELINEGWHEKIAASVTVHDTWNTACDLCIRLYPSLESQVEEMREAGASGEPRETGEGESEGSSSGSKGSKRTDTEGDDESNLKEGYNISWKDAVLSEHNEWGQRDVGGKAGVGITWEDFKGGSVVLAPTSAIKEILLKTRKETTDYGPYGGSPSSFLPDNAEARALGNQIRRYIQSRAKSVVSRHKLHGQLDKGSLIKMALPPIDKGDYNRKLFYTYDKRDVTDTAISILVDWSGSMIGKRMELAADAANRLAHVLSGQIGIPVEIMAFTTRESCCDMGIVKDFNERAVPMTEVARRFSAFYKNSSGNNDADAVAHAHRRLLKRKETRRVLIVLSDGAPTDNWKGGHADANLKFITSTIEKDRRNNIELWGVGIQTHAVERYYSHNIVLPDVESINSTLFTIVKSGYEKYRREQYGN